MEWLYPAGSQAGHAAGVVDCGTIEPARFVSVFTDGYGQLLKCLIFENQYPGIL